MESKIHNPPTARADEDARRMNFDLEHVNGLNEMRDRCYGLDATIIGSGFENGPALDGLLRIAMDVGDAMERLTKSFKAEWQLRLTEEHCK